MDTRSREFSQDRERLFDLAQTQRVADLSAVPRAERDAGWESLFFPAVWYASLEVGPSFRGPDHFPYLRMHLPVPGKAFQSNSVGNVARGVVEQGLGIAVFASPEATEPIYVFPMGVLGSVLEYDSWQGDPVDLEELARAGPRQAGADGLEVLPMRPGQKIFVGSPANTLMPPYVARALHHHLRQGWKIEDPRIGLLLDPSGVLSRNLVVNKKMCEFPDGKTAGVQSGMLLWYLPPKRGLLLMPEDWKQETMTPLTAYFAVRGSAT